MVSPFSVCTSVQYSILLLSRSLVQFYIVSYYIKYTYFSSIVISSDVNSHALSALYVGIEDKFFALFFLLSPLAILKKSVSSFYISSWVEGL